MFQFVYIPVIFGLGDVHSLFDGEDVEKCIIACRLAAKQAGISESDRDGIFNFFIQRVRMRLHVVLCMSPIGDAFRYMSFTNFFILLSCFCYFRRNNFTRVFLYNLTKLFYRRRCRMFPSLVNCCTIDWFMPWPQEALISVAEDSLKQCVDAKLITNMSSTCFIMHSVSVFSLVFFIVLLM